MDRFIGRGEWLDWLLRKTKEKIWKKWVEGFKGTGVKCEAFFPLHVKACKGVSTSEESVTNQPDRMTQPDVSRWYQPVPIQLARMEEAWWPGWRLCFGGVPVLKLRLLNSHPARNGTNSEPPIGHLTSGRPNSHLVTSNYFGFLPPRKGQIYLD